MHIEFIASYLRRLLSARVAQQGLQVSLEAAKRKLASLDRSIERNCRTGTADLGMPIISDRQ